MSVVIVIAHGHALAVTLPPGDRRDSRCLRHVLERAVAAVAKEPVARSRGGLPRDTVLPRMQVPALDAVHVEPAVAVEVEQPHSSGKRLGQQTLRGLAVVESKAQTGRRGVVDEFRNGTRRIANGRSLPWRGKRCRAAAPRRGGGPRGGR